MFTCQNSTVAKSSVPVTLPVPVPASMPVPFVPALPAVIKSPADHDKWNENRIEYE